MPSAARRSGSETLTTLSPPRATSSISSGGSRGGSTSASSGPTTMLSPISVSVGVSRTSTERTASNRAISRAARRIAWSSSPGSLSANETAFTIDSDRFRRSSSCVLRSTSTASCALARSVARCAVRKLSSVSRSSSTVCANARRLRSSAQVRAAENSVTPGINARATTSDHPRLT